MSDRDLFLDPDRCPVCGFRPRTILPNDAMRAIRSLPRRWREILIGSGPDDNREDLIGHPLGNGPSAVGHAALVTEALHRAADELAVLRTHEHPALETTEARRPAPLSNEADAGAVLDTLADGAARLAEEAQRFSGHDWLRSGTSAGRDVTALQVLRRAVHEGTHRLHEVRRGLIRLRADRAALRGAPNHCPAA